MGLLARAGDVATTSRHTVRAATVQAAVVLGLDSIVSTVVLHRDGLVVIIAYKIIHLHFSYNAWHVEGLDGKVILKELTIRHTAGSQVNVQRNSPYTC